MVILKNKFCYFIKRIKNFINDNKDDKNLFLVYNISLWRCLYIADIISL
jgi:hypothetical protein